MYRTSFVLILCCMPSGCSSSGTTGGQAQETDAQAADRIKALIPEATSLSSTEWQTLLAATQGGKLTKIEDMPNQSVSLVILIATAPPKDKDTFSFETEGLKPGMLATAMEKSNKKGYATLIQPEFITECKCTVEKDKAEGTVSFRHEGNYRGKIEFTARKIDGAWRIEEFRLPGMQVRVQRGENGKWKMSKM